MVDEELFTEAKKAAVDQLNESQSDHNTIFAALFAFCNAIDAPDVAIALQQATD